MQIPGTTKCNADNTSKTDCVGDKRTAQAARKRGLKTDINEPLGQQYNAGLQRRKTKRKLSASDLQLRVKETASGEKQEHDQSIDQ